MSVNVFNISFNFRKIVRELGEKIRQFRKSIAYLYIG